MMFVTIEDTSSSLELLVFPRTYETTKDIWQEGKIVVVMGKTSESEDDDKLFVEKAYELAEQTAPAIFAQLGMGQSLTSPPSTGGGRGWGLGDRPEPKEKVRVTGDMVEIIVPEKMPPALAQSLKEILAKYPGDKVVYLLAGEKKIKTSFRVAIDGGVFKELENLV